MRKKSSLSLSLGGMFKNPRKTCPVQRVHRDSTQELVGLNSPSSRKPQAKALQLGPLLWWNAALPLAAGTTVMDPCRGSSGAGKQLLSYSSLCSHEWSLPKMAHIPKLNFNSSVPSVWVQRAISSETQRWKEFCIIHILSPKPAFLSNSIGFGLVEVTVSD